MASVPPIVVPVVIVQDKKSNREVFGLLLESLAMFLVKALVVMLLLGNVTDWGLSYVQVLTAIAVINAVKSDGDTPWRLYTRSADK